MSHPTAVELREVEAEHIHDVESMSMLPDEVRRDPIFFLLDLSDDDVPPGGVQRPFR